MAEAEVTALVVDSGSGMRSAPLLNLKANQECNHHHFRRGILPFGTNPGRRLIPITVTVLVVSRSLSPEMVRESSPPGCGGCPGEDYLLPIRVASRR